MHDMKSKLLKGIISDLVKYPMEGKEEDGMDHEMSDEPKEAHVMIVSAGKPGDLDPDMDGDMDDLSPEHEKKMHMNKAIHAKMKGKY